MAHVDSKTGPAVFYRLRDLTPGDEVTVTRADHRLRPPEDLTRRTVPTGSVIAATEEAVAAGCDWLVPVGCA